MSNLTQALRIQFRAIEALEDEAKRLRLALLHSREGFRRAYEAAEKHFNDEVLLTCGHHEAHLGKVIATFDDSPFGAIE